jgi:hypothetical protein
MNLGSAPPFLSRSAVKLLELGVFGRKNLEWSLFLRSGVVWSCAKHALYWHWWILNAFSLAMIILICSQALPYDLICFSNCYKMQLVVRSCNTKTICLWTHRSLLGLEACSSKSVFRKTYPSPFLDKFLLEVFLHPSDALSLSLLLAMLRERNTENLLFWGKEWWRSSFTFKAHSWFLGNASLHNCQSVSLKFSWGDYFSFDWIRCVLFCLFQFPLAAIPFFYLDYK